MIDLVLKACPVLTCVLYLVLTGCGGPVTAVRADPKAVRNDLVRSAVTTGNPSWPTRNVLYEHGLFGAFNAHPGDVIAKLHRIMVEEHGNPDLLFALSELSFLHGQKSKTTQYNLAAAVYAYAFLFPEGTGRSP